MINWGASPPYLLLAALCLLAFLAVVDLRGARELLRMWRGERKRNRTSVEIVRRQR